MRARTLLAFAIVAVSAAVGARDRSLSLVPWKVLPPGSVVDAPLTLYWIPESSDALKRSPLLTSQLLRLYASRCVAMRVVRYDDGRRLAMLDAGPELPVVALINRSGTVIGRLDSRDGPLTATAVENLVLAGMEKATAEANRMLDEAKKQAAAGETEAAVVLYRRVWDQRCLCPREGRDAHRALRKLGHGER